MVLVRSPFTTSRTETGGPTYNTRLDAATSDRICWYAFHGPCHGSCAKHTMSCPERTPRFASSFGCGCKGMSLPAVNTSVVRSLLKRGNACASMAPDRVVDVPRHLSDMPPRIACCGQLRRTSAHGMAKPFIRKQPRHRLSQSVLIPGTHEQARAPVLDNLGQTSNPGTHHRYAERERKLRYPALRRASIGKHDDIRRPEEFSDVIDSMVVQVDRRAFTDSRGGDRLFVGSELFEGTSCDHKPRLWDTFPDQPEGPDEILQPLVGANTPEEQHDPRLKGNTDGCSRLPARQGHVIGEEEIVPVRHNTSRRGVIAKDPVERRVILVRMKNRPVNLPQQSPKARWIFRRIFMRENIVGRVNDPTSQEPKGCQVEPVMRANMPLEVDDGRPLPQDNGDNPKHCLHRPQPSAEDVKPCRTIGHTNGHRPTLRKAPLLQDRIESKPVRTTGQFIILSSNQRCVHPGDGQSLTQTIGIVADTADAHRLNHNDTVSHRRALLLSTASSPHRLPCEPSSRG